MNNYKEVDGVVIRSNEELSEEEIKSYINYGRDKYPDREIIGIEIKTDGDYADLKFELKPKPPFERIRRITGYLVGTLDRFNNGKLAEVKDRVKHGTEE